MSYLSTELLRSNILKIARASWIYAVFNSFGIACRNSIWVQEDFTKNEHGTVLNCMCGHRKMHVESG